MEWTLPLSLDRTPRDGLIGASMSTLGRPAVADAPSHAPHRSDKDPGSAGLALLPLAFGDLWGLGSSVIRAVVVEGKNVLKALATLVIFGWLASAYGSDLISAVERGDIAAVEEMLANGADPNARDDRGWTALYWAATNAYDKSVSRSMVAALLDAGAEVNARVGHADAHPTDVSVGKTALHRAGTVVVVRLLLEAGAEVNARDREGDTPLHDAAMWTDDPRVVHALLAGGAKLTSPNLNGETPLHYLAKYNENILAVEAMLAYAKKGDVDRGHVDEFGFTPRAAALQSDNPAVRKAFLAAE